MKTQSSLTLKAPWRSSPWGLLHISYIMQKIIRLN